MYEITNELSFKNCSLKDIIFSSTNNFWLKEEKRENEEEVNFSTAPSSTLYNV